MKRLVVPTDPSHWMEAVTVGAGSPLACVLVGVDARFEAVEMAFGTPDGTHARRVAARPAPGGELKVDAPAACFPSECRARYHVTGVADGTLRVLLGGGTLRVLAAVPPAPDEEDGKGNG